MRSNERRPQLWRRATVGAPALLIILTIGTALAAVPSTTAYHFSSHPMISGTVVTVNDHQMVVDTDQGERATLEIDSRTMAPRDLAPGMVMRAEFLALEDCRFYVERIMPIRGGMSASRLQAYANTRDSREALASNGSARGESGASQAEAGAGAQEGRPQAVGEHSPGTTMTAIPATADYQFSTRPMISGRVASVNDHRLIVETDQGQQVGLVMDSRTMVPGEVAPGSVIRAEFTQMMDGRHYAKRISLSVGGISDREQAYAHTLDSDAVRAQNIPDCGFASAASGNTAMSTTERHEPVVTPDPVVAQSVPAPAAQSPRTPAAKNSQTPAAESPRTPAATNPDTPAAEGPETLPRTASSQPLILLLGLVALGAAGALAIARRRHAA